MFRPPSSRNAPKRSIDIRVAAPTSPFTNYGPRRPLRTRLRVFFARVLRKRRLLYALAGLFVLTWLVRRIWEDSLALLSWKARDWGFEKGWKGCNELRKEPIFLLTGEDSVIMRWEGSCQLPYSVDWGAAANTVKAQEPQKHKATEARYVYSLPLDLSDVAPGTHLGWTLYQNPVPGSHSKKRRRGRGSYIHRPAETRSPAKVTFDVLGDNQWNPRTFSWLLRSLDNPKADWLIHLGDGVENGTELAVGRKMWQTDFWDPLTRTRGRKGGPAQGLIAVRGNHDQGKEGDLYLGLGLGQAAERDDQAAPQQVAADAIVTTTFGEGPRARAWFSFSPHDRLRVVVLDSNVHDSELQMQAQEKWLQDEVEKPEWKEATLRIIAVHSGAFVEWWEKKAWEDKGEKAWVEYVRHRLVPILSKAGASVVLSGHSHTYSRGFLPTSFVPVWTASSLTSSSALPGAALASVRERTRQSITNAVQGGTLFVTSGGAGGGLDREKVEDWGFYGLTKAVHHSLRLAAEFDIPPERLWTPKRGRRAIYRPMPTWDERCGESGKRRVVDRLRGRMKESGGGLGDEWEVQVSRCVPVA